MRLANGKILHPAGYRYFEGGDFPNSFECDGKKVTLKTSFRDWLKFDQLIQAENLSDEERMSLALVLCVADIDAGFPYARITEGLVWFHGADANDRARLFDLKRNEAHKRKYESILAKRAGKKKSLSLFWDTHAIWSSFMAAFGIDLFRADLHWWGFLNLLGELPENSRISQLIRRRSTDPNDIVRESRDEFVIEQKLSAVPVGGVFMGDV